MEYKIDSGIAAILGAIIGSSVSIVIMLIQRKADYKKELMRIAYEMAKVEMNFLVENRTGAISLLPIEAFYRYHYKMLQLLNKAGVVDKREYDRLQKEKKEFEEIVANK